MDLEKVARSDDYQMKYVYSRKRDEEGNLIGEKDEAKSIPVSRRQMYWSVMKSRGMSEEEIMSAWKHYVMVEEPGLVEFILQHEGDLGFNPYEEKTWKSNSPLMTS